MLSDGEKAEIDKEIKKFPKKKHACLDALLAVQKHRGYIDDDALKAVADYLGMSACELDGTATFYNLIYRKPVGKNVIRLCDSISCWIMGYENIKKSITEHLSIDWGQTTLDHHFTLLRAQCLGACDKAPVMMINDKLIENLTPKKVHLAIDSYHEDNESNDTTPHKKHENGRSTTNPRRVPVLPGVSGRS